MMVVMDVLTKVVFACYADIDADSSTNADGDADADDRSTAALTSLVWLNKVVTDKLWFDFC